MYHAVPLSDDALVTESSLAPVFPCKAEVACPHTQGPDILQGHGEGTTSMIHTP